MLKAKQQCLAFLLDEVLFPGGMEGLSIIKYDDKVGGAILSVVEFLNS
jgi:hypothetical protein